MYAYDTRICKIVCVDYHTEVTYIRLIDACRSPVFVSTKLGDYGAKTKKFKLFILVVVGNLVTAVVL